jgi:nitroimidazol reductase NimA-like FMN-containing flavoprotein (pyridoxamine 5'-phosphate oxidase superfamily)
MMRRLDDEEIALLLSTDTVVRLATTDAPGYSHVTPLWFLWESGTFRLASDKGRRHLDRIQAYPQVGLVVDIEDDERQDGERPNRQVRAVGHATLSPDRHGTWSAQIWAKYLRAFGVPLQPPSRRTSAGARHIRPTRLVAVAVVYLLPSGAPAGPSPDSHSPIE